ncbi:MAG TPA: NAD(P)H-binding protein [Planctomycetota bacterium]|nr:NAD(P)H-binding protein [Planctomycetota bacterium]
MDESTNSVAAASQPEASPAPVPETIRTIAVVGEIPFSGAAAIRELYNAGYNVRVLCPDEPSELAALASRKDASANSITTVRGDLENESAIRDVLQGAFAVVFLSPVNLEGRIYRSRSHLEDCKRLIAAAEASAIRKIVYHSALGAYSKALSRTMREAAQAEQLFQNSRCEDYCVRTAPLMGRGDGLLTGFVERAKRGSPFMLIEGYGSTMLQPLHVNDLAVCLVRIFRDQPDELAPDTYQLAGPEVTTILDLYDQALARAGRFKFKFHFPLFVMKLVAMAQPGSAFEERLNLLYDLFFTDKNDAPKLAGPGFKPRTTRQAQEEVFGAA